MTTHVRAAARPRRRSRSPAGRGGARSPAGSARWCASSLISSASSGRRAHSTVGTVVRRQVGHRRAPRTTTDDCDPDAHGPQPTAIGPGGTGRGAGGRSVAGPVRPWRAHGRCRARRATVTRAVAHSPVPAVVVVPVKAFDAGQGPALGSAAAPRAAPSWPGPWPRSSSPPRPRCPAWCVACDDEDVADWARGRGAAVAWTPGTGPQRRGGRGGRPRPRRGHRPGGHRPRRPALRLGPGPARPGRRPDEVRRSCPTATAGGTNVMSVPTDAGIRALPTAPAPSAATAPRRDAAGLRFVEVRRPSTSGWDVDEPDDLDVPAHLGPLPGRSTDGMTPPTDRPGPRTCPCPPARWSIVAHPDDAEFQAAAPRWPSGPGRGAWSTTWC